MVVEMISRIGFEKKKSEIDSEMKIGGSFSGRKVGPFLVCPSRSMRDARVSLGAIGGGGEKMGVWSDSEMTPCQESLIMSRPKVTPSKFSQDRDCTESQPHHHAFPPLER